MFLRSILRAPPWTVMAIAMAGSAMTGAHAAEAVTGSAPASKAANPVAAGGIVLAQRGPGGGGGGGRAIGGGGGGPRAGGGPRMGPGGGPRAGGGPRMAPAQALGIGRAPDTDAPLATGQPRIQTRPWISPTSGLSTRSRVSPPGMADRHPSISGGIADGATGAAAAGTSGRRGSARTSTSTATRPAIAAAARKAGAGRIAVISAPGSEAEHHERTRATNRPAAAPCPPPSRF